MRFAAAIARAERTGWAMCGRSGQLVDPVEGYVVPIRRNLRWSVHHRRLEHKIVSLYVYSRAQEFAANPPLLLHIARVSDHYLLGVSLLIGDLYAAFRTAELEDGDLVYDAITRGVVTRRVLKAVA